MTPTSYTASPPDTTKSSDILDAFALLDRARKAGGEIELMDAAEAEAARELEKMGKGYRTFRGFFIANPEKTAKRRARKARRS